MLKRQGARLPLVTIAALIVAAFAVAPTAGASTNLITDGQFNDTADSTCAPSYGGFTQPYASDPSVASCIPGWTVTSGDVNWSDAYWNGPASGDDFTVDLNGSVPGALEQSVATTSGQAYTLSFALSANPDCEPGPQTDLEVDWNGTAIGSDYLVTPNWDNASMVYATETATVTGTGSDTLDFVSHTDGLCGPVIGDVGLTPQSSNAAPTSTVVSCSPGSVVVGQASSCTATVTDTDSGTASTPTGSVSFSSDTAGGSFSGSGSCSLSATSTAGQAQCSVSYTPGQVGSGTHTVSAGYGGDSAHATSSGNAAVTVTTRSTSIRVRCSAITSGRTRCTAAVADISSGTATTPTGTVSFTSTAAQGTFIPGSSCTLSGSGTRASCGVTYKPAAGTQTITGTYNGDSTHAGSRGSTTVTL